MKATKILTLLSTMFYGALVVAQQLPVNCDLGVPGCSTPSFQIVGTNPSYNVVEFSSGSTTNPSSNPQGVNSGCLLSGETVSTYITINVVSNGFLEWSMIGLNGSGNPSNSGCFDWIMWPDNPATGGACAGIASNTLPPVACNWNGSCNGNTGMALPGNLPPGGFNSSYQPALAVTAGQQFVLLLSNYSGVNQNVNLNFFGTAAVSCEVNTADQTICLGESATVNIVTTGITSPTFNWLVTTGVSNPNSGAGVIVTPSVTTEYVVQITALDGEVFMDTFTIFVLNPPTPNAGPDQIICFGQAIQLQGTPSDPTNTTTWSVNTAGITPTPNVNFVGGTTNSTTSVTVNQPGLYTFNYSEANEVCTSAVDSKTVLVSRNTHTTSVVSPSCATSTNGSITINNTSPGAQYSFDGGATWGTSNTQGGFGVGTYPVWSQNEHGCLYVSNVTITAPPAITITTSTDTLICRNGIAELYAQANVSMPMNYIWSHTTDVSSQVSAGPFETNQTITVYAESVDNGCTSETRTIIVSVREPLTANISQKDTICPGYETQVFVNNISGGLIPYTILWSTEEQGSGYSMTIVANPPQTRMYEVTVSDVCETDVITLTTEVYVAPVPVPQIEVVERVICEPAVFELHNTTDPTMQAGFVWYYPTGNSAINEPIIFTDTLMQGNYSVQLIVTSPLGCIDSLTLVDYLVSEAKPTANFSWSPNPVKVFNTQVHFQDMSFLDHTYEWIMPGAVPSTSTLERPRVTYPEGVEGRYPVTLIVTSELGCTDTLTQEVVILPEVLIFAPNTFTPDGDEFNNEWNYVVHGVDLYSVDLVIYNRWGQPVFESKDPTVGWDGTYNGKMVEVGTYVWKLSAKDRFSDGKFEWNGIVNLIR